MSRSKVLPQGSNPGCAYANGPSEDLESALREISSGLVWCRGLAWSRFGCFGFVGFPDGFDMFKCTFDSSKRLGLGCAPLLNKAFTLHALNQMLIVVSQPYPHINVPCRYHTT